MLIPRESDTAPLFTGRPHPPHGPPSCLRADKHDSEKWLAHKTSTILMEATKVPNPWRSSACDCTCVVDWSLVTLSCLPCTLFCSYLCKVCSQVSDILSQALCNLSLAFLTDFTLSGSTALIHFITPKSLANYTLLFVWIERHGNSIHMSSILQVQQLCCCRQTYCQWPIISELAKNVSPKNKINCH